MNITRFCSWLVPVTVALSAMSSTAEAQFLLNCCMPDGSCQTVSGNSCADFGGINAGASCLFASCGCAGNCGGQAPVGCWCDSACHNLGDCCNDVCQHCTGPQVPACSCQGNCGGQASGGCWCDLACFNAGDCCGDVCNHCTGVFPDNCITCTGNTCAAAVPTGDGIAPNSNNGLAGCSESGTTASCAPSGKDRWFVYTATCTGEARANVCSEFTSGNVAISVFSACPAQGGVEIACSNTNPFCTGGDANPNANAEVMWPTVAGQTYHVRVSVTPNVVGHAFFNGLFFECTAHDGACCFTSDCTEVTDIECANLGGEWLGPLTTCDECILCDVWSDLAGGLSNIASPIVSALAIYDGDLIVGGSDFIAAGGVPVSGMARWNGASQTWHPFGNHGVNDLTIHNGDLIAGGWFTSMGGQVALRLARWDGSAWHPVGIGNGMTGTVLTVLSFNGDLIVGGNFSGATACACDEFCCAAGDCCPDKVPECDGCEPESTVDLENSCNDLCGGFWFYPLNSLGRWDGSAWHHFNGMNGSVRALAAHDGDLIAGGGFTFGGDVLLNGIGRWNSDESVWVPFDVGSGVVGVDGTVFALTVYKGDLIAGGSFIEAGSVTVNHIARWDSASETWQPMGEGLNNTVRVLTVHNGNLIAGGDFTTADGITVNLIARWDDDAGQWEPLGGGLEEPCSGGFCIAPSVRSLASYDGDLFAGGTFIKADGKQVNFIARWTSCDAPGCGHPDAGSCFAAGGSHSCDNVACCSTVCAQDPFCCQFAWDDVCAMQAQALCTDLDACGSATSSGCFKTTGSPGCKQKACCEVVCAEDPSCCAIGGDGWHENCVALAQDICTQPGFGNSGGQTGTFSPAGAHGLFTYEVKYFNGSLLEGELCCGLTELPQEVTANFVLDIFEGIGTTPGFTAGIENVVSFSLQFGNNHWTDLLLFDMTLDAVAPNMATELFWLGTRLDTLCDPNDPFGPLCGTEYPLNFPLTFKGTDASGKPFEILYTDSICELIPTSCNEIGCCEGHCGGMSPLGCACDADCVNRGDCCSDFSTTCAACPADLTGDGIVNVFDLLELLAAWGPCPAPCPADLDNNGIVNVFDLLELLAQWGECP